MSLTPALEVRNLHKSFAGVPAVTSLHLRVEPSEVVSLMGPSGCGKTTTLRLIAGLEAPDAGSVSIDGVDRTWTPTEARKVGFVFQDYALFPHLSVAENVGFGLGRLTRADREARVAEVLDLVGLGGLAQSLPHSLSGGQQQRVALARALAPCPALLLLDEPLCNLDAELRRRMRHEILSIIRSSGSAAVWVTHDREEGLIVADRVVVMYEGTVRQEAPPPRIWSEPADAWVAAFIGRGDLVPGRVSGGMVRTVLGDVQADGLREGSAAFVLARPHDVRIDQSGRKGKVVRRHFNGTSNVYCVELEDGLLLHCEQPLKIEISRGTEVGLSLTNDRLPVFSG